MTGCVQAGTRLNDSSCLAIIPDRCHTKQGQTQQGSQRKRSVVFIGPGLCERTRAHEEGAMV